MILHYRRLVVFILLVVAIIVVLASVFLLTAPYLPQFVARALPDSVRYSTLSTSGLSIEVRDLRVATPKLNLQATSASYNLLARSLTLETPVLELSASGDGQSGGLPRWLKSITIRDGAAKHKDATFRGVDGTIHALSETLVWKGEVREVVLGSLVGGALKQTNISLEVGPDGLQLSGQSQLLSYDTGTRAVLAPSVRFEGDTSRFRITLPRFEVLYDGVYFASSGTGAALTLSFEPEVIAVKADVDTVGSFDVRVKGVDSLTVAGSIPKLGAGGATRLLESIVGQEVLAEGALRFALTVQQGKLAGRAYPSVRSLKVGLFNARGVVGEIPFSTSNQKDDASGSLTVEHLAYGEEIRLASPSTLQTTTNLLRANDLVFRRANGELRINTAVIELLPLRASLGPIQVSAFPLGQLTLTGRLEHCEYKTGTITTSGSLSSPLFEGAVRIDDPSAVLHAATYAADLYFSSIDLQALSASTNFGEITGVISGSITNLSITGGIPQSFEVSVASAKGGSITVEALENLSVMTSQSLVASLSRGIYKLIDSYRYRAIGLSAQLRDGVLTITGTARAGSTEYIVRGGFLPPTVDVRLDTNSIRFDELLERLRRIKRSDSSTAEKNPTPEKP